MKRLWFLLISLVIFSTNSSIAQSRKPLSLQDAVQMALTRNPLASQAVEEENKTRATFWLNIWPEQPELSAEYEEVPIGAGYSQFGERKIGIAQSLEFPVYYWQQGKYWRHQVEAARADREAAAREVTFLVTTAYWKVVLQQRQVKLAQQELALSRAFFEKAQRAYELGESDRLTMLRAKVNLGVSREKLLARQSDLARAWAHLREVLAVKHYEDVEFVLSDTSLEAIPPIDWENAMPLVRQHPRLRRADAVVNAAVAGKRLACLSWLPGISVRYFRQTIAGESFWGGEIGLRVPLWVWRQGNEIRRARAEWRQAIARHTSVQLSIKTEFDLAKAEYDKALAEVELYREEMLAEAREAFRIARQSYALGEIGYLDFLDAQQALIATQENYYQALYQLQVSRARLARLTGR